MTALRTILAALVFLGAAAVASAQPRGPGFEGPGPHGPGFGEPGPHGPGFGGPGPPGPGHFDHIARVLDLDAETEAAVQRVIDETRDEGRALHDRVREAQDKLHDLLSGDAVDEKEVMAQAEVVGAVETEARMHRLQTMLRIRELLTPEQRTKLMGLRDEHRERAIDACASDVARLCPDARDVRDGMRCLAHQPDELSEHCRGALPGGRHRRFRGF